MNGQQWIPIKRGASENTPATKTVQKSGSESTRGLALDETKRFSTRITYRVGGVWKGVFAHEGTQYDTITVPEGAVMTEEGLPAIPQEGIFVAVPNEATNIEVKLIRKTVQELDGTWRLPPVPKPITEEEYLAGKEEFKPLPEVYDSDAEYPGKDFDFLGLRSLEGVPVVHLIVYLTQYKPKSGSLAIVKTMVLEISYDVPPQTDAVPTARFAAPALADMILDYENVQPLGAMPEGGIVQPGVEAFDVVETAEAMTFGMPSGPMVTREALDAVDAPVLKQTNIACEYVIIAPNSLVTAVQPLLQAKMGWPHYARVAQTQTISAEFPASNLKESIRAFLSWAWSNWRVPPRYVVLAGDVDTIPVHVWSVGGGTYASDHYYADIRDNLSPEIVVSRIPTSDATRMQQVCQRLAQYTNQRGPDWGGWQNEIVLVAYEGDTYKQCSDDIASAISPRFRVTRLYGDSSTRQQVIDRMNAGVLAANYRGHGSKVDWQSANGLRTAEIRALDNGNMPPLVFCICCQNAWLDDQSTECVVETFLREGKCVAVFGASRNSPTYANNDFDKYLWRAIMDSGEVTPGGIVQRAKALMVQNHANSTSHQQDVVMYLLFGDPTAKVMSTVEFLRGTWDMDHDGWKGTLVIDRIWNSRVEKDGSCGYPVWSIAGVYTGQDGTQIAMTGKIGGRDPNDRNPGCKRKDTKVSFTVAFAGNNQSFEGYVFGWTRSAMAGYTWWHDRPFGWYAKKR
jgi:hypothetical protein